MWHFSFTDLWNKIIISIWPEGGSKAGMCLVDANPSFQFWVHMCACTWRHHRKGSSCYPRKRWDEAPGAHHGQEPQGSPAGAGGSRSWHRLHTCWWGAKINQNKPNAKARAKAAPIPTVYHDCAVEPGLHFRNWLSSTALLHFSCSSTLLVAQGNIFK